MLGYADFLHLQIQNMTAIQIEQLKSDARNMTIHTPLADLLEMHVRLAAVLDVHDVFWIRWNYIFFKLGVNSNPA